MSIRGTDAIIAPVLFRKLTFVLEGEIRLQQCHQTIIGY